MGTPCLAAEESVQKRGGIAPAPVLMAYAFE